MKTKETTTNNDQLTDQLDKLMASAVRVSGFTKKTILSDARFKELADLRLIFYYLAITMLDARLSDVSDYTGRSHAAIISGYRRIKVQRMYAEIAEQIKQIKNDFLSSNNPASER